MSNFDINRAEKKVNPCHRARGLQYVPFLRRQTARVNSNKSEMLGWKVKRNHHFLSEMEAQFFYLAEFAPNVIEVREQFALDPSETWEIEEASGIQHPKIPGKDDYAIRTTDFLLTVSRGGRTFERAIAVKPSVHLADKRVIEKLEIERLYWKRRGVQWSIATEKEIDPVLADNIKAIHPCYHLDHAGLSLAGVRRVLNLLLPLVLREERFLSVLTNYCESQLQQEPGTSLRIVRHLLATRQWTIDFTKPFRPADRIMKLLNSAVLSQSGVGNSIVSLRAAN